MAKSLKVRIPTAHRGDIKGNPVDSDAPTRVLKINVDRDGVSTHGVEVGNIDLEGSVVVFSVSSLIKGSI